LEDYDRILEKQGGGCAICGKVPSEHGWERSLAVDHDHACCPKDRSCGKCIRGLLCAGCNTGLGKFYDNVELLMAAAAYIKDSCCDGQAQPVGRTFKDVKGVPRGSLCE
jgi:hypothetical protein